MALGCLGELREQFLGSQDVVTSGDRSADHLFQHPSDRNCCSVLKIDFERLLRMGDSQGGFEGEAW